MYLKKIVLDGFKSFYTRTEIDLKSGIIGVVGPNGCGKSNIYDAVQWVLGEQSAKELRGDEISDVISTGNVRRGEKNYAEAYLTFDDCQDTLDVDRDEIEVGRRVDRDGSGTYYLNGDTVRLKDIQDLFRDTGIGQDLYSTIGQGEVFSLIESKPEERREIIEEAAGIASYRHRRDLTKRRLEQTRDELQQVEKDLRQKKGRLSQLKGQAEKAEQVKELQTKLRKHKMEKARREYRDLQESIEQLQERIEHAKEQFNKARQEKEKTEQIRDKLRNRKQRIHSVEREIDEFRKPLQETEQKLRRIVNQTQTEIKSQLDKVSREQRSLEKDSNRLEEETQTACSNARKRYRYILKRRITKKKIDFLKQCETKQESHRRKLEDELERIRDRSFFNLSEKNEVEQRLKHQRRQIEELQQSLEENDNNIKQLQNEFCTRSTLRDQFDDLVEVEKQQIQMTLRLDRNRTRQTIVEALTERLETELNELRTTRDRKRNDQETLKRQLQSYEGFNPGVKKIMNAKENGDLTGVIGILADLIEVPDDYQQAVESALNGSLQGIVVGDNDDVTRIVDYVKQNEIGSVTLLTQDSHYSETNGNDHQGSNCPGFIGRASEFVQCDEELRGLVRRLLSSVGVVEKPLEAFRWLQNNETSDLKSLVTRDGLKLDSRGQIFVGTSTGNDTELLRRKGRKERLEKELRKLNGDIEGIQANLKILKSMGDGIEKRREQVEGAVGGLRQEQREYQDDLRENAHEHQKSSAEFERLLQRRIELRKKLNRLSLRQRATSRIVTRMESVNRDQDRKTEKIRSRMNELEEEIRSIRENKRSHERGQERIKAKTQDLESRIDQLGDRRNQIKRAIGNTISEREKAKKQRLELERDLAVKRLQRDYNQVRLETWDDIFREFEEKKESEIDRLDEINQKLQSLEGKTERLKGKVEKRRSELTNEKEKFEEITSYIQEEFDVNPSKESLEDELDTDLDDETREEIEKTIRTTQNEINEHTPVNMLAEQEATELEEEVTETEDQKQDLEEASQELEGLIGRLNKKAREQFLEAFSEIQDYFEDFIGELFQGGEGKLQLTDDEVLEAGVTIEIKPPGESIKNMSALSGGEKTLGALAFLFALYEHKSTPFCFLDEVDQSFDDENVNQFVNLLVRYKERTQFLVITHNKITMQAADKLFGVTMEESGVTSIVPMELEQAQELREPEQATA